MRCGPIALPPVGTLLQTTEPAFWPTPRGPATGLLGGAAISTTGKGRRMEQYGIGQAVPRFEDPRLLRGEGNYIQDVSLPRQAHAVLLRSPHAHARLVAIDLAAARRMAGVLGIWTETDLRAGGLGTSAPSIQLQRPDGKPMF